MRRRRRIRTNPSPGSGRETLETRPIAIEGIPEAARPAALALFRSRLMRAVDGLMDETAVAELELAIRAGAAASARDVAPLTTRAHVAHGDPAEADRSDGFAVSDPAYTFSALVVPAATLERLLDLVALLDVQPTVFDEWGLRAIEPHPFCAVNFHGEPGTGKTLAAHALAQHLGRRLLIAKASDVDSKFHGEGPKNLTALFEAARRHAAVLFIDEADSLLSQRFASPSQGAEHAINTMRSELVMCLDRFEGLVLFATNLVGSYDRAFDSRVHHVEFCRPDEAARVEIWKRHLPATLPVDDSVDPAALAATADVTGRDIKRAVLAAAVGAARRGRTHVTQEDLRGALTAIRTFAPRLAEPAEPTEPTAPEDVARIEAAVARIDTARAPRMPPEAARR